MTCNDRPRIRDEVGDREPEGAIEERLLDRGGHHERRSRGGERDDRTTTWVVSAGLSVQVNCVHAHQINQNRTRERSTPSGVRFCGQRSDLGHGEHEDEVEEELDERDALLFGACSREGLWAVIARTVAGAIGRQPGSNVSRTSWLEPPLVWRTSTGPTPRA